MDVRIDTNRAEVKVERRRRQIASSYRKQGYRVISPSRPEFLPPFLHDCHPDLIAEKEGDRVVIEVKASHTLKGSNDLVELANRVAGQAGWRLELVTVGTDPDYAAILAPGWIERMLQPPTPETDMSYRCVFLGEILTYLIKGAAFAHNVRIKQKSTRHLLHELAFRGIVDQDVLDRIEDAFDWQDLLMRRLPLPRPPVQQAVEIEKLCRDLYAQAQATGD